MEATSVYWIPLYTMLEDAGIEVCLVNPNFMATGGFSRSENLSR
jgi:transposase